MKKQYATWLVFALMLPVAALVAADSTDAKREVKDQDKDGIPERIVESKYDGTNLVMKTVISDTNDDGTPDQMIVIHYRQGKKACMLWRHMDQSNLTSRIFFNGDRQLMIDKDENGDGLFETFLFLDAQNIPCAIFKIDKDGAPSPLPEEEFRKYVESFEFGNKFVTPALKAIAGIGKTNAPNQAGAAIGVATSPVNTSVDRPE